MVLQSTVTKALAERLNYIFLDTGAMHRAVTYTCLKDHIDLNDESQCAVRGGVTLSFDSDEVQHMFYKGEDISNLLRTKEVNANISDVCLFNLILTVVLG
jgi:cytidylate kinase